MPEKGILACGVASRSELAVCRGWPSAERLAKGPVAVIECIQEIPCNPCETACPKGAITVGNPITNCPQLHEESCIGCGLCIAKCPGLAIFVVDMTYSESEAAIQIPYEYADVPACYEKVDALNRYGAAVGEATVQQITVLPSYDKTMILKITVPKELAMEVRNIRRRPGV